MLLKSIFPYREISEGCAFLSGYAFKSKDFSDEGIPVVKIKNIQNKKVDFGESQFLPESLYQVKLDKFKVFNNDVLIAMTGQGSVGRVGQVKIGEDDFGLLNQRVGKFVCDEIELNRAFLFYILSSARYQEHLFQRAIGSGQPNLSPTDITTVTVPYPTYSEQRAIAAILSALDDKIELNLQMNKTLEEMAMTLYKHWFVDFGPFQDGEFVDSELGMIPKGWEVKGLAEITENHSAKRRPISTRERTKIPGKYPYYGATKILDYIETFMFDGDFILVAEDGTVKTDSESPFLQYVHGQFCVSNHAHVLAGKNCYSNDYIHLALSNIYVIPYITGAVQLKINRGNLERMQFVVANDDLMKEFCDLVAPWYRKMESNNLEIESLTKTRDTLLPKLISGEVRVKELEKMLNETP